MVKWNILQHFGNIGGRVYLPFNPHFFILNSDSNIKKVFNNYYLKVKDLTTHNHKLSFVKNSITDENKWLGFKISDQENYLESTMFL